MAKETLEMQLYNKYKDKITIAYKKDIYIDQEGNYRCKAKRTKEREKYLFKGFKADGSDNIALIECAKDILAIEFEQHSTGAKQDKKSTKQQRDDWIRQTKKNAEQLGLDVCIASHGGTSDYGYLFNLIGLPEGRENEAKKIIARAIIPEEAQLFLDWSNLGKTLIPPINRQHWKTEKYKGAIHAVIDGKDPREHKNNISKLILEKLKPEIKREPKQNDLAAEIKRQISLKDVMIKLGFDLSKNPTKCQWHGSKSEKCFSYDDSAGLWHCFHCDKGGDAINLVMEDKGLKFIEAAKWINKEFNLNLNVSKKEIKEDNITEAYFGIKIFNKTTSLYLTKDCRIYDHTKISKANNSIIYKTEYSLYEASTGAGNQSIFIKTNNKLDTGDNNIYMQEMSQEEIKDMLENIDYNFLFHTLAPKKLYVKTTKGTGREIEARSREEIIADILDKQLRFFKPILAIPKEELSKVNNFLELTTKILKDGTSQISDKLIYTTISHIPEIDPDTINPDSYMRYSDNEITISTGGEGKTTITEYATGEPNTTEPTAANLLGSSDGKIKWYGKLHQRTKILGIDEIQDMEEDILGKLNNYIETGRCNRGKGTGIEVRGHAPIRFLGNIKPTQDEQEYEVQEELQFNKFLMIKRWRDFLAKLSRNVYPFNRRIGTLIIDMQMAKVRGSDIDQATKEKGTAILRTISEGFRKEFTGLFFDKKIIQWLNADFDKEYLEHIDNLAAECKDGIVKDSILARKESFRHTKGQALKLSWLETGLSYYLKNGNYNIDEIIGSAEDHLERLKNINLSSVQTILELTKSDLYKQIEIYKLQGLKPRYLQLAIYTLFEYLCQQKEINRKNRLIPLSLIEQYYEDVKDLFSVPKNDTYRSFYEVCRQIEKNSNLIKVTLEDLYLEYDDKEKSLIILDNRFYDLIECYVKLSKSILQKLQILHEDKKDINNPILPILQKLQNIQKIKDSVVFVVCSIAKSPSKSIETEDIVLISTIPELIEYVRQHQVDNDKGADIQELATYSKNPKIDDLIAEPKPKEETIADPLEFDPKLIEYRKCSIENCSNYETNPDSEGKPFCKDHWEKYAKK